MGWLLALTVVVVVYRRTDDLGRALVSGAVTRGMLTGLGLLFSLF